MPLADYSHWNEEATQVWWQEEGKHSIHVDHYDDDEPTLWDEHDDVDEDCTSFDEEYEDWEPATDEEIERSFDANR